MQSNNETTFRYLIATDMTWLAEDIVKAYAFRWLVEVFIQDWKSHEGWNTLAKQRGEIGSDRGVILSLMLDHALLLHDEQQVLHKQDQPAATVGSLKERVTIELDFGQNQLQSPKLFRLLIFYLTPNIFVKFFLKTS